MRRSARLAALSSIRTKKNGESASATASRSKTKKRFQVRRARTTTIRKRRRQKIETNEKTTTSSASRTIELRRYAEASSNTLRVVGVDEAGRGPLAGPVVAAAVHVPENFDPNDLGVAVRDSKLMSEEERENAFDAITRTLSYGVGVADCRRIDEINILAATMEVMAKAVDEAGGGYALIDGNRMPPGVKEGETLVKGDSRCFAIACASVIAKVTRDRMMLKYDKLYPGYGLAQHKGYPTASHRAAVASLGASPIHRLTFAPLKTMTAKQLRVSPSRVRWRDEILDSRASKTQRKKK